jgi:hypothetical protein
LSSSSTILLPDPEAIVDYYIKRRDDKMALITNNHEITKDNNVGEVIFDLDVSQNKVKVISEKNYGI